MQIRPLPRAAYRPGKQRTSDDNGVRYRLVRAHIAALPVQLAGQYRKSQALPARELSAYIRTSSKLVIVNLHLEAYDDGEGKIAQTKQLREFIQSEYEKGNYVIAGGDFNQIFPNGLDKYPNTHKDLWEPGTISEDIMPEGWTLAYDLETPSCRLLNQPPMTRRTPRTLSTMS